MNNLNPKINSFLSNYLNINNFSSGTQIIRNDKGWRVNEVQIEFIWLVIIDRALVGKGGILNIKYKQRSFREFNNPEQQLKCIFLLDNDNEITEIFHQIELDNFNQIYLEFNKLDLYNFNNGITLDGVGYNIFLDSNSVKTNIFARNPKNSKWIEWEKKIFKMASELSIHSENHKLIHQFT